MAARTRPSSPPELEPLLSDSEAADLLGLSRRTLQDWRYHGGGPPYVKCGKATRYAPRALREWIESRTRTSTSDPGPARASA